MKHFEITAEIMHFFIDMNILKPIYSLCSLLLFLKDQPVRPTYFFMYCLEKEFEHLGYYLLNKQQKTC